MKSIIHFKWQILREKANDHNDHHVISGLMMGRVPGTLLMTSDAYLECSYDTDHGYNTEPNYLKSLTSH